MINPIVKTIELPDGRTITLETGKLAKQADGSVMLRMGNTMLLATVCAAKDAVPGTDFMPLQVEYKEKFAAFGRFPGGFTKREGRASDYEILTCRLVDRALRPLFPDNYHAEVYVNIILFSADGVDMPDALAGLAASAALAVSDIPFNGPISEVRVARIDGQFVINPTFDQLEKADMDLMVAATYENIMMVEGEMDEVSEKDLLEAMKAAHEAIKIQCKAQMELAEEVGSTVKREYCHEVNDEELRKAVHDACYDKAYAIAASGNKNKHERMDAFDAIREEFKAQFSEEELEEIFKRTYYQNSEPKSKKGYQKRCREEAPARRLMERSRAAEADRSKPRERYLLVDGYNIIFSWEMLRELSKVNIESARNLLMDVLCDYQGFNGCTLILVFDAYRVEGGQERVFNYHNIHVVFTKEAETADQYIEKTVHKIGKKADVTVATSDALEQVIIYGQGARRMAARELLEEVELTREKVLERIEKRPGSTQKQLTENDHNYLFDHLPEELVSYMEEVRLGKREL